MTGEDRELVDELAILNRDMVPLAVGIMESTAGAAEQVAYGDRLIAVGKRLQRRPRVKPHWTAGRRYQHLRRRRAIMPMSG